MELKKLPRFPKKKKKKDKWIKKYKREVKMLKSDIQITGVPERKNGGEANFKKINVAFP